jgi:antitoxin FitA
MQTCYPHVKDDPDPQCPRLKARAAQAGMSLSDYLLNEIQKIAEVPTWDDLRERLSRLPPVTLSESPAEIIRRIRDQE